MHLSADMAQKSQVISEHVRKWPNVPKDFSDLLRKVKKEILMVAQLLQMRIDLGPTQPVPQTQPT